MEKNLSSCSHESIAIIRSYYLTTFGDFMIIPIKHLENGGRSERHSGGVSSSTSET